MSLVSWEYRKPGFFNTMRVCAERDQEILLPCSLCASEPTALDPIGTAETHTVFLSQGLPCRGTDVSMIYCHSAQRVKRQERRL
ncbi:unnamed protein product [Merluccius merluccius]